MAKTRIVLHVPIAAVRRWSMAGGRVDIMFDAAPSLLAMIQAGKIRPLAAASQAACRSCLTCQPSPRLGSAASTFAVVRRQRSGRNAAGRRATAQRRDRQGICRCRISRMRWRARALCRWAAHQRAMMRWYELSRRAGVTWCARTTSKSISAVGTSPRLRVVDAVRAACRWRTRRGWSCCRSRRQPRCPRCRDWRSRRGAMLRDRPLRSSTNSVVSFTAKSSMARWRLLKRAAR